MNDLLPNPSGGHENHAYPLSRFPQGGKASRSVPPGGRLGKGVLIRVIINYCNVDLKFKEDLNKIGLDALSVNGFRSLIEIFKLFKRHEATAVSFLYEKHSGIKVNHRILFKEILSLIKSSHTL